jgi:hypothetical protein
MVVNEEQNVKIEVLHNVAKVPWQEYMFKLFIVVTSLSHNKGSKDGIQSIRGVMLRNK